MITDYFLSAEDIEISFSNVIKELQTHNVPDSEYQNLFDTVKPLENGMYNAQDVLIWLGY